MSVRDLREALEEVKEATDKFALSPEPQLNLYCGSMGPAGGPSWIAEGPGPMVAAWLRAWADQIDPPQRPMRGQP